MLGSANVTGSGGWACASLASPVSLNAGQSYMVAICGGTNPAGLYYQQMSPALPRYNVDIAINQSFFQSQSSTCTLTDYGTLLDSYMYGVADIKFLSSDNSSGLKCGGIASSGTYNLTSNLTSAGTCFTVSAPNVAIDCAGYSITGANITNTYGVYSNQANTTVKNCKISKYTSGVYFNAVQSGAVQNITVVNELNPGYGILSSNSAGISISNSSITSSGSGIYLDNTTYSNVSNTAATAYGYGLYMTGGYYTTSANTVQGSQFTSSSHGIYLQYSHGTALINTSGSTTGTCSPAYGRCAGIEVSNYMGSVTLVSSTGTSISDDGITITGASATINSTLGVSNNSVGIRASATPLVMVNSNGTSYGGAGISITSSNATLANLRGVSTLCAVYPATGTPLGYAMQGYMCGAGIALKGSGVNMTNSRGTGMSSYMSGSYAPAGISYDGLSSSRLDNCTGDGAMGIYASGNGNVLSNMAGTGRIDTGFMGSGSNSIISNAIGISPPDFGQTGIAWMNGTNNTFTNLYGSGFYSGITLASIANSIAFNITGIANNSGGGAFGAYGITLAREACQPVACIQSASNSISNAYGFSNASYGLYISEFSNTTIANSTFASQNSVPLYADAKASSNSFVNNTVASLGGASTLAQVAPSSGGNTFCLNNFSATSGKYINDMNGSNYYNCTYGGIAQSQGNIYANVLDRSIPVFGSTPSSIPNLYIGTAGAGVPYSNTTSANKFSCNFAGCADFAPLNRACVCGALTAPNSVCSLSFDLNSSGTCFTVAAQNVTISCNGHSITGSNASGTYGVYSNQASTAVRNCSISSYSTGIYFNAATNGTMDMVKISTTRAPSGIDGHGIYLGNGANYNRIANSNASSALGHGIFLNASSYNIISNSTGMNTDANHYAIYLVSSSYNTLANLTAYLPSSFDCKAIVLSQSSNNSLSNIVSSGGHAIWLTQSSGNTLSNITASSDCSNALLLTNSSYNALSKLAITAGSPTGGGNYVMGLVLESGSSSNSISNAAATTTSGCNYCFGFVVQNSSNNNFSNIASNVLWKSSYGFGLYGSSNNTISNITAIARPTSGLSNSTAMYINGSYNTLSGITASAINRGAFYLAGSYNTASNINATSISDSGFVLSSGPNNTVSNLAAASASGSAITISGSSYNSIINSTGTSPSSFGAYLGGSNYNRILSSNLSSSAAEAIYLNFSNYNIVSGGAYSASSNASDGVGVYGSSGNMIANLTLSSGRYGVYLSPSSNGTAVASNVINSTSHAIFLDQGGSNNISFNAITRADANHGIYLYSSTNNVLSSNAISVASGKGIYIYYPASTAGNNNVSGNIVSASNGTGIDVENAKANRFNDNIATSGRYGFFLGGSTNNSFVGDRGVASGGSGFGFFVTDSPANRFANITGTAASGIVMRLQQSSDANVIENMAASTSGNGTGIYVDGVSGTNITGAATSVTSSGGDAVYISSSASNTLLLGGSVSSVDGNGITAADGSKNTTIANMSASSSGKYGISIEGTQSFSSITGVTASSSGPSGAGIYLATSYSNVSGSSGASTSSGYGIWVHGGSMLNVENSNFTSAGTSGSGAAAYFDASSTDNKMYSDSFRSSSSSGDLLVLSESTSNLFYWNNFTYTTGFYAKENGLNTFNTSIGGRGEGNSWYNVMSKEVSICGAFRPTKPEWASDYFIGADSTADPSQYPYNAANARGRLSGSVVDSSPLTTDRCWFPPLLAPKNYTQSCSLKSCNVSADCMAGDAPYCDAGCNQLSHTCYPCVTCENAYCLPAGQPCAVSKSILNCGTAACNAGVCTSTGETCPGAPGLSCCPSSYCSGNDANGVCVPKKAAGTACASAVECAPSAPYCSGTPSTCKSCLPLNAANCTSNSECCPGLDGKAGICNLAQGTAGANTCVNLLPAGGKTCASSDDCASGSNLTCKEGVCATNHPPAAPASVPVLSISSSNGTESITCTQNCVANNMPSDPDRDTPVKIEYRWVVGNSPATGFWHNSPTFNCELLPSGCLSGTQIRIQARACDKYGACSPIVESAYINTTKSAGLSCRRAGSDCSLTQKCCSGMTCRYENAAADTGTCLITSPVLNCSSDANCLSGLCRPNAENASVNVCVDALSCSQSCTLSSQCPAGCSYCANGACSSCMPVNSPCSSNSQCCAAPGAASGLCSAGTCKSCAPAAANCTLNSECCSGSCQDSLNANSKVCAPSRASSPLGGACLRDADCAAGFCDTLNRGGKIGVISYGSNTTVSDYGQCMAHYAPYTLCNISSTLPAGGCELPYYSCVKLNSSSNYYCIRTNGSAGTQFSSWVKVGGVHLDQSSALHHSGTSSAAVSGGPDTYAYNSVLMGSLEGDQKYSLEFWAQTPVAGTLARYALYDTINNAYLNDAGQWLYAGSSSVVPTGGIIEPTVSSTGAWKQVVKVFKTLPNAKIQLRLYPAADKTYYVDDLSVASANDFSMLAWVRADAPQPGGVLFSQISSLNGTPQGINWTLSPAGILTLGMYSSGSQAQGGPLSIAPTVSLADGKWHQVALSVDRTGNYSVFLDGSLMQQSQFTLGSLESAGTFYIGSPGTSGFSGELGEVRFYKRALTPADVLDHYNGWFQQQCKINLAFSYTGAAAQNLTAAYNADLRIRKLLPETILALPFDVNVSSDGRGMIVDYSRFLGAGTKTGAAWTPNGKVGGAYVFTNATDKILLPSALVSGAGDFTVSAWIYSASANGYIMGNFGTGNQGGFKLSLSNYQLSFQIGSSPAVLSQSLLSSNSWHHVAATRKGGVVALYVDGALNATGPLASPIAGLRNFAIGNGPDYATEHFSGTIDEVRAFSRALTDAEILSLYNDNALSSSQSLPLSQK